MAGLWLMFGAGLGLGGCVAPFSELQSARLAGKGRHEITPMYTTVSFSEEGESEKIQSHYGLHYAAGLSERVDLRLRVEHIALAESDGEGGYFVVGAGPKFALVPDRLAIYTPVGFAFGSDIDVGETFQFHPALVGTVAFGQQIEVNPSVKLLVPLSGGDVQVAANIGLGLSADVTRWAIRPEFGWLWNSSRDASGTTRQFSVGFTIMGGARRE
jgi:hypothetical protein